MMKPFTVIGVDYTGALYYMSAHQMEKGRYVYIHMLIHMWE